MPLEQILVLAIVQGITEFLPISSSGHLILIPVFTGWKDQGMATDVMVHVGSLAAIIVYFWRDVLTILARLCRIRSYCRSPLAGSLVAAAQGPARSFQPSVAGAVRKQGAEYPD